MQTTLIITMAAIFLTWLYIQQKRLAAYERYCVEYRRIEVIMLSETMKHLQEHHDALIQSMMNAAAASKQAAESLAKIKNSIPK